MDALIEKFKSYGSRIAFADNDLENSYESLADNIRRFKEKWDGAIRPGQVVVLISDYSFLSISIFFGLAALKAVLVPVTTKVKSEIDDRIEIADADWIIRVDAEGNAFEETRAALRDAHPLHRTIIESGHPGLILFSSGSTGRPKAMLHDLHNLADGFLDKREKSLVFLVFLMFDHIGGLNTLLNGLSMGSKLVFSHRRDPEDVCLTIQKHGVNVLPASPTFLNLLLMSGCHERFDLSSIRMVTYGTEPMPEQLLHRIKAAFPRTKLLQTFGTSETGIAQTVSKSSSTTLFKIEDPNTEIKIVDGELWIRSKAQVLGYLNAPMDAFTEDGWFRTGDLVEPSEDGFFRIRGRLKEIINVGGEKVLPVEVETVLLGLDFVSDCMVFAESNSITGQIVAADVVLKDGFEPDWARKQIKIHCNGMLDRYKVPARINFVKNTTYGERFKKFRTHNPDAPGI